ncbi:terminase large subunit [Allisonella histaminiformans]|uniref:terminase large subunit n=1 Tax=Allisonella histaminiformans TaxID=209880 RepID=UPI002E797B07|nr:terminase TerL endonuclease subunit [Allisonella histaminiformans]
MNYIEQYYNAIETGRVTVSAKVQKTYKHLVDKLHDKDSPYIYDDGWANYVIDFIQTFCKHSKGKWGGRPVILELWQKAATAALFGFIDKKTRLRQYRQLILIIARKNGKSTWATCLGLYLLIADGEAGPEIYSAATKRDQAKIIWNEARRMIRKSPALHKKIDLRVSTIRCGFNEGIFEPLGSDSEKLDGLNVHGALIDELHAIKDKNLYDVIVDGMTAREQPLCIITTTAGTVRDNIFDLKYEECERIINGYGDAEGYHDDTILPIVYELDSRDEWTNPDMWEKANPGLGSIKNKQMLAQKVHQAQNNPLLVKNLLCKDFNVRETGGESFFTFEQLNNEQRFDSKELKPRYGIGGIDLSDTTDLTCATMLFMVPGDDHIYVKQMYWIPEELFDKRVREDNVPYDIWYQKGLIQKSPGFRNDFRLISEWFKKLQDKEDIYLFKCGYDRWSAAYLVKDMEAIFGEQAMVPIAQGKKTLSAPMKNLAADLTAKKIVYNNNPILKWCMTNVAVDVDRNDNIQPCKTSNPRKRIDGFASLLDAYTVLENCKDDYLQLI